MKKGKFISSLASMIVLGLIGFALLGWLVEYREGRAVESGDVVEAPAAQVTQPALVLGTRTAADQARRHLEQGKRTKAVHAMDAALRAAEIGKHVAQGAARMQFEQAVKALKDARHVLQMGRPEEAEKRLVSAADALAHAGLQAPAAAVAMGGQPPPKATWSAYRRAGLINAQGVRVGEVEEIRERADSGAELVLVVGGGQDVLGFIDFGGTRLTVPASAVLFGKPKTIGMTMVALSTLQSSASAVLAEYRKQP